MTCQTSAAGGSRVSCGFSSSMVVLWFRRKMLRIWINNDFVVFFLNLYSKISLLCLTDKRGQQCRDGRLQGRCVSINLSSSSGSGVQHVGKQAAAPSRPGVARPSEAKSVWKYRIAFTRWDLNNFDSILYFVSSHEFSERLKKRLHLSPQEIVSSGFPFPRKQHVASLFRVWFSDCRQWLEAFFVFFSFNKWKRLYSTDLICLNK